MENLDLVFVGIVLNIFLSAITPFLDKKWPMSSDLVKKIIIVLISIFLAILYNYYGESLLKSFVMIIGTASAIYGLLTKDNDRVARIVKDNLLK